MLRSYLTSVARGSVILRKEILEQIGIGPNGYLYAALHPVERAAILSPIPPDQWGNAYKIIIHTKHKPGCVANATRAIREAGFNTVSSWVSCESHFGHACCTSIVLRAC